MSRKPEVTLKEKAFAREYVLGDEPGNGRAALTTGASGSSGGNPAAF